MSIEDQSAPSEGRERLTSPLVDGHVSRGFERNRIMTQQTAEQREQQCIDDREAIIEDLYASLNVSSDKGYEGDCDVANGKRNVTDYYISPDSIAVDVSDAIYIPVCEMLSVVADNGETVEVQATRHSFEDTKAVYELEVV